MQTQVLPTATTCIYSGLCVTASHSLLRALSRAHENTEGRPKATSQQRIRTWAGTPSQLSPETGGLLKGLAQGRLAARRGAGQPAGGSGGPTVIRLLLRAGVRAQELGESPVPGQQLLVGAHLRDLASGHDDDDIHLRQVADAVRDQEPRLRAERGRRVSAPGTGAIPYASLAKRTSECRGCPSLWVPPPNTHLPGAGGPQGGTQTPAPLLGGGERTSISTTRRVLAGTRARVGSCRFNKGDGWGSLFVKRNLKDEREAGQGSAAPCMCA